ncbi:hypothetical protein MO973_17200 [Paenibacillus sp. TRM 82003]|uniref:hypothetical protein n=1 Tax=Kineococcus sp. TRM81007 TaxID=2925831 RepID=UPI001F5AC2B9|nr:hypothetical protein [Kineococcus sp. TRM81007]MCI2238517.1 hypothetical protein [Kineococcus sp. TRM81007]MCI3921970.1 hypothetical protein [Paenibacillus sp. TRM 82003]
MATSDRPARARLDALGSTAHLAGSGAGLLALLGGFAATQHPLVAVGTCAVGYLSGYLLCPGRSRPSAAPGPGAPAPAGTAAVHAAVEAGERALRSPGVPADVVRAGRHVLDTVAEVLPRWQRLDALSPDARTVETVAGEHLPGVVTAYLSAAGGSGASGAERARTEALEQLALLQRAVHDVRERLQRRAEQDLAVHGAFLRDKFDRGALDLGPAQEPSERLG